MPIPNQQRGYILILVLVLMAIMTIASLQYTARTTGSLKTISQTRDANQSLLIAESAMNTLYANFVYDADLNNDGTADNIASINRDTSPPTVSIPYLFFLNVNNDIAAIRPGILQNIATSEASGSSNSGNAGPGLNPQQSILISNLYSNLTTPVVFSQDSNGTISRSNTNWSQLSSTTGKAISWLEAVEDADNAAQIKIYVQAVGEFQGTRSYVQRLAGSYSQTMSAPRSTIIESNTQ